MADNTPTVARFYYFHVDNKEEIKNFWKELAVKSGIEIKEKDATDLIPKKFKTHGLTEVATVEGSRARLSMSLYKNVAVIAGLFFLSEKQAEKIESETGFDDLVGINVAIGRTTLLISKKRDLEERIEKFQGKHARIEIDTGTLFQFEEKEGEKKHFYCLGLSSNSERLKHFLTLHFPIFDFAIHKLHVERDYFKNQRKWIMNEKVEIDKTIGDILHKRIVGETLNPEYIEVLEKEIDALSTKYALLVNDGHLIRKAKTVLEDGLEEIHNNLQGFAKLGPEASLDILKPSVELKKKLQEDEISIGYAIKNTKTAIDTVRTNVDLLRSRENILLQEEAISFQVAAGVLEFIIIFYYSIASWEHLIGVGRLELIPPPVRFISVFLFASFSVILTHFIGKSFKEKWTLNKGLILSGALMLGVFLYIVYISIQTGALHAAEVIH